MFTLRTHSSITKFPLYNSLREHRVQIPWMFWGATKPSVRMEPEYCTTLFLILISKVLVDKYPSSRATKAGCSYFSEYLISNKWEMETKRVISRLSCPFSFTKFIKLPNLQINLKDINI